MSQIRLFIMYATSAGTGKGGTSIYGGHFKDEIHPSLGHRGECMTPHSAPFLFSGSSKRLLMLHHGSSKAVFSCVCSGDCKTPYQVCNCQFSSSSDPHKCKETLNFQRHGPHRSKMLTKSTFRCGHPEHGQRGGGQEHLAVFYYISTHPLARRRAYHLRPRCAGACHEALSYSCIRP